MSDLGQIIVGLLIGYVIGMFPSADLVTRLAPVRHCRSAQPWQR